MINREQSEIKPSWLFANLLYLSLFSCRTYKNLDELCALFKSSIVDPVLKPQSTTRSQPSQERNRGQRSRLEEEDPLRVPPRRPPMRNPGGWYVHIHWIAVVFLFTFYYLYFTNKKCINMLYIISGGHI